jgi:hypothetical protein
VSKDLDMLKRRHAHHSGASLAERHAAAASAKARLEEEIKKSIRLAEKAERESSALEKRLAARRKGASSQVLKAVSVHQERVQALQEAQVAFENAPWEQKAARRAEVTRLHDLAEKGARDQGKIISPGDAEGAVTNHHFVQELLYLENQAELAREALAKLVARTKAALDHAQEKYREIDEELAEADRAPFFSQPGGEL